MGGATLLRESQQGGAGLGLSKHVGRQEQLRGHGGRDSLGGDDLKLQRSFLTRRRCRAHVWR